MAIQKPPVAPLYFSVVSLLLLRSFFPLFRTGPVSFNFFQRLSGGFRHKFPDNQHIRHAHDGEQEENEQEEAGYSQAFAEKEVSTDQEKGKDHARYAVVNQFLTSHFVDDDKRQDGGQGVN